MRIPYLASVFLILVTSASQHAPEEATAEPKLLTWSEQIAVREEWVAKRHQMLLPMMRRHKIDMCEVDPVF